MSLSSRIDIMDAGGRGQGSLGASCFVQNLGGQSDAVGADLDVRRRSGHAAGPDPATKQAQEPLVGTH